MMCKKMTFEVRVLSSHLKSFKNKDGSVIRHAYIKLRDWPAGRIPDNNNPRSHNNRPKGDIANKIGETLERDPENFCYMNRGLLVVGESCQYDPDKEILTIVLTDYNPSEEGSKPAQHGLADGGTTDKVLEQKQKDEDNELNGFIHVEIITNAPTNRIAEICEARNTSLQVRPWSMDDFKGKFDELKVILENTSFGDNIMYDENDSGCSTILEVIGYLNMFHPVYDRRDHPTISYSSKGSMHKEFSNPKKDFTILFNIAIDILELRDYILSTLDEVYKGENKSSKRSLERWKTGANNKSYFPRFPAGKSLPYSSRKQFRKFDNGLFYPLFASFRSLIEIDSSSGKARWKTNPEQFWLKEGYNLLSDLLDYWDAHDRNANVLGKSRLVYSHLYDKALLASLSINQ